MTDHYFTYNQKATDYIKTGHMEKIKLANIQGYLSM